MRVVIVVDRALITGGAPKVALMSAQGLARRGHEVSIFAGNDQIDPFLAHEPSVSACLLGGVPFHQLPSRTEQAKRMFGNAEAGAALARHLERFSPTDTVVHIHTFAEVLSGLAVTVPAKFGFRTVLTCHDYSTACPTSVFYNFKTQKICTLEPFSAGCLTCDCTPFGWKYKLPLVTRNGANRFLFGIHRKLNDVVFLSELSENVLRPFFPASIHCHRIPNPQDLLKAEPADVAKNQGVLFVGRLVPEKAPVLAARAAALADIPITFCGDGVERSAIQAANPRARMLGWVPAEEVRNQLRCSKALVMSSIWYECSPLVTVEAQSNGLPVISSDSCASRESVEEGVTGYTFRSGDAESLAEKLRLLLQPGTAARMGQAAYDRVWKDPPTLERHAERLETLYAEMLART